MFNLKYRIKRTMVWFKRITHLKGNGVQSPFAYDFLCQVINNSSPYYAYDDLAAELKALPLEQRKQAKLLFRLANWRQPQRIVLPESLSLFEPFVKAGCKEAEIIRLCSSETMTGSMLIVLDTPENLSQEGVKQMPTGTLAVVLNIRKQRRNRWFWKHLISNAHATLTFDLYHTGVILVNPNYSKHHYIVNF